jgi:hypothetical protein
MNNSNKTFYSDRNNTKWKDIEETIGIDGNHSHEGEPDQWASLSRNKLWVGNCNKSFILMKIMELREEDYKNLDRVYLWSLKNNNYKYRQS